MEIQEKVRKIIEESFPGCQLEIDLDSSSQRVTGFLIWSGFEDIDQMDRQNKLWDVLKKRLGDEATRILAIFTHTPNEYEAMMAA